MADVEIITGTVDSLDKKSKNGAIWVKLAEMDGGLYPVPVDPVWPPGSWICFPEPGDTVELVVPAGEDIVEYSHDVRYLGKRFDPAHSVPSEFKTNYGYRRGFKTKAGHMLVIDDKAGTIELTNGKSGDSVSMSATGTTTIEGTIATILDSPSVKLGGSTAAEFLIKGTTFALNFGAMLTAWNTAASTLASSAGAPADVIAYANAVKTLIGVITPLVTLWLSTVSATE